MGDATGINWTTSTWNPWVGCRHVSAGCENCYMFREQRRYGKDPEKIQRTKTTFTNPLKWKDGRKIFTCSFSDFFIQDADPWRDEAWDIIRRTPQHTYQILTKRPDLVARRLPEFWDEIKDRVWIGVSAEDQDAANRRLVEIARLPLGIRFVSFEPLLGPIKLNRHHIWCPEHDTAGSFCMQDCGSWIRPDWAIIGGESGPGARRMDLEWARSLLAQCQRAGVAVWMKQLGSVLAREMGQQHRHGADPDEWPEDLRVQEFPQSREAVTV